MAGTIAGFINKKFFILAVCALFLVVPVRVVQAQENTINPNIKKAQDDVAKRLSASADRATAAV